MNLATMNLATMNLATKNLASINPWQLFDELHNERPHFFVRNVNREFSSTHEWRPSIDIFEADTNYVLSFDLPGVDPKTVDIQVENNILKVKGNRKDVNTKDVNTKDDQSDDGKVIKLNRREKTYGDFSRSFQLPEDIDQDSITAEFNFGVLNITIDKQAKLLPKKITINAK